MMKIDEVLSRGVLEDGLLDAFEPEDVEFAVLAASAHDAWVVSSDDSRLLVSAMVRDPDEGMEPSLVRVWLNDAHGLASVSEDSCGCEEHGRCRHAAAALAAFATKMEAPDVFAAFFDYAGLEGCGEEAPNFDEVRSGKDDADDAGCAIHASRRLGMESFDDVFPNPARTAFADIAAGAEKDGDEDLEGFLALLAKGPSVFLSSFDSGAVRRGKEYWRSGYVLGISYDTSKRVLRGSVDGSERKPYTTTIALSGRGSASPRRLSGECSCYLGGSCKHVVATLMEMEKAYHAAGKAAARTSSTLAPAPSGLPAGRPTSKKTAHGLPVVASSKDLSGQTVGRASGGSAAGAPSKPSRQGLDLIREISSSSADASGASGSDRPAAKTEPFEFAAVLQHQASLLVSGCETLTIDLFRRKGRKGEWSRCTAKDMLLDAATSEESAAARLLLRADEQPRSSGYGYNGRGALLVPKRAVESFGPLLETLVAAGMARMDVPGAAPMKMGEDVPVSIRWKISKNGSQSASIHLAGSKARVLDAEDLWYLDPSKSSLGRVVPDVPVRAFLGLLKAKGLDPADASALRSALDRIPGVPEEAKPRGDIAFVEDSSPPTPVLSFFQVKKDWRRKSDAEALSLTFDYGGKMGRDGESRAFDGKVVRVRRRDPAFEASVRDAVVQWGWAKERYASATDPYVFSGDDGELMRFAQTLLPEMEEAGWRISGVAGNPRLTVLDAAGEWEIDEERPGPDGTAGWWFELGLGFEVDGKKIDLLPVLRDVVRGRPWPPFPTERGCTAVCPTAAASPCSSSACVPWWRRSSSSSTATRAET